MSESYRYPSAMYPGEFFVYEDCVTKTFLDKYLRPCDAEPNVLCHMQAFGFLEHVQSFKKSIMVARNEPAFNYPEYEIINKMHLEGDEHLCEKLPISICMFERMFADKEPTRLVRQLYHPTTKLGFAVLREDDMKYPILAIVQTGGKIHNNNLFTKDGRRRKTMFEDGEEDLTCQPLMVASIRYLCLDPLGAFQIAHAIYHDFDLNAVWTDDVCMK